MKNKHARTHIVVPDILQTDTIHLEMLLSGKMYYSNLIAFPSYFCRVSNIQSCLVFLFFVLMPQCHRICLESTPVFPCLQLVKEICSVIAKVTYCYVVFLNAMYHHVFLNHIQPIQPVEGFFPFFLMTTAY